MAEREDVAEISLSVRNNEEDVSPESLAWADSCIISFPDDNNWENFRDALTEIIDIHPDIFVPSVSSPDEVMTEAESVDMRSFEPEASDSANTDNIISSSNEQVSEIVSLLTFEPDPSKNSLQDHYFPESVAEKGTAARGPPETHTTDIEGTEEDGSVRNGEAETSQVFKDDFMSRYIQDNADDFDVSEDLVKVTPQEIFKVWDLEIVGEDDEEDGLVLQLEKALHESSTVQPLSDDHVVVEESNIDDLIAGISDLSLTETFLSEER